MFAEASPFFSDHVRTFDPLGHVVTLINQPVKVVPVVGMQDRQFKDAETVFQHTPSWFVSGEEWCLQVAHNEIISEALT